MFRLLNQTFFCPCSLAYVLRSHLLLASFVLFMENEHLICLWCEMVLPFLFSHWCIIDLTRLLDINTEVYWDTFWGFVIFTACLKWKCLRLIDVIFQACHPKITGTLPVLVLEQQCSWTTNHQELPLTNSTEVFMCVRKKTEGITFEREINAVCPPKYVAIQLKRLNSICYVWDSVVIVFQAKRLWLTSFTRKTMMAEKPVLLLMMSWEHIYRLLNTNCTN